MNDGITWQIGPTVTMNIDRTKLPNWTTATTERQACLSTALTLEGGTLLNDKLGCVTLTSPGFARQSASVPDRYGVSPHTLEIFLSSANNASSRMTNLLSLGTTAIDEFERSLGMPLWERHWWPAHVEYQTGSGAQTTGTATVRTGAFLAVPDTLPQYEVDYLFVEQLARLAMADLADRAGGSPPFWVQEVFVQWLASSALYRFYPSASVHGFHAGRINDYLCYVQGQVACQSLFSGDGPLSAWGPSTLQSTGSVRSLILALELDAMAGSQAMGQALATYANGLPSEAVLADLLAGFTPAKAAQIKSLLTLFVDGTGNAAADKASILQELQDSDGDGLYLFEEQKLGTSDSVPDNYLN
jgi:hypothetical protein